MSVFILPRGTSGCAVEMEASEDAAPARSSCRPTPMATSWCATSASWAASARARRATARCASRPAACRSATARHGIESVGTWLHANLERFVTGMDESAVSGPESGAATTGAPSSSAASGGDSASDSTSVLRAALIHNDYKYDNLVLDPDDPTRILAVVDWEMATIGDPLLDLGTTLCYWVQADDPEPLRRFAFGPTRAPGTPTRRQLADRYAERSGRHLDDVVYAYAFGLYKTAVVAQQIYYRWTEGHTTDERFASMIDGVRVLGTQGVRTISRNSLP